MEFAKLSLRPWITHRHVLKHNGIDYAVMNLRNLVTHTKQVQQQRNNSIIQCVPLEGSPGKCWFTKRTKVQYICMSYL
jgi:hypothetical protein